MRFTFSIVFSIIPDEMEKVNERARLWQANLLQYILDKIQRRSDA